MKVNFPFSHIIQKEEVVLNNSVIISIDQLRTQRAPVVFPKLRLTPKLWIMILNNVLSDNDFYCISLKDTSHVVLVQKMSLSVRVSNAHKPWTEKFANLHSNKYPLKNPVSSFNQRMLLWDQRNTAQNLLRKMKSTGGTQTFLLTTKTYAKKTLRAILAN